ncbi:hypothetical protein BDV95DRAFT_600925 [Massariosphaeria phaeospora]|uniref:C2H2-type domain-containing protein n=1 Tax=Massariosphaeria phaeospora TaxID=100035 RepID=A0A7C8MGZ6_9PLEO|nr:hypothetical protein BDV95DRAFT_600925 [Massariosphaeria phaeospora]
MSMRDNSKKQTTKRSRKNYEESGKDEDDEDRKKRARRSGSPPDQCDTSLQRYACPFLKYNTPKYKVLKSCREPKRLHRIKEHLYRVHRLHQCRRCKITFDTEDATKEHSEADPACEVRPSRSEHSVEGVNDKKYGLLRSRANLKNKSEFERWEDMYRILFPDSTPIPSPLFDTTELQEDHLQETPENRSSQFIKRCREELPVRLGTLLTNTIHQHLLSVMEREAERLSMAFKDLEAPIQNCIKTAFEQVASGCNEQQSLIQVAIPSNELDLIEGIDPSSSPATSPSFNPLNETVKWHPSLHIDQAGFLQAFGEDFEAPIDSVAFPPDMNYPIENNMIISADFLAPGFENAALLPPTYDFPLMGQHYSFPSEDTQIMATETDEQLHYAGELPSSSSARILNAAKYVDSIEENNDTSFLDVGDLFGYDLSATLASSSTLAFDSFEGGLDDVDGSGEPDFDSIP